MDAENTIGSTTLRTVASLVDRYAGLRFTGPRRADLALGIKSAAEKLGFASQADLIHWLLNPKDADQRVLALAQHLTVGETYFFRDQELFRILETELLQDAMSTSCGLARPLRIWSAGCSSGEECYSIAVAAHRVFGDAAVQRVEIIGTDINHQAILQAREGVYRSWSFRGVPESQLDRYFSTTSDGKRRIATDIRRLTRFRHFNLSTSPSEADVFAQARSCDLIFCRNVLMYLSSSAASHAIALFHRALVENGWLIVAPTDVPTCELPGFTAVLTAAGVLYRKDAATPADTGRFLQAKEPTVWDRRVVSLNCEVTAQDTTRGMSADGRLNDVDPGKVTEKALMSDRGSTSDQPRSAVSTTENDASALTWAMALADRGRVTDALETTAQLLARDETNLGYLYVHACLLVEAARLEEAKTHFERMLYLDADLVAAAIALGHLAIRQGDGQRAMRHFGHAVTTLERLPGDAVVPFTGGVAVNHLLPTVRQLVMRH